MTRDEKAWWQTIDSHPGDLLILGQFADWLQEQMHPWGTAMRYAYEKQLVPHHFDNYGWTGSPIASDWLWYKHVEVTADGRAVGPAQWRRVALLPAWLKPRGGWRWYKSCSSAYQSYCKRFAYWEEHYPLKFAKLVLK